MKPNAARQAANASSRQMQVRDADAATIARYCKPREGPPAARPPPFAVDRPISDGMAQMAVSKPGARAHGVTGASRPQSANVFESGSKRKSKISVQDVFPDDELIPDAAPAMHSGGVPFTGTPTAAPTIAAKAARPPPGDAPQPYRPSTNAIMGPAVGAPTPMIGAPTPVLGAAAAPPYGMHPPKAPAYGGFQPMLGGAMTTTPFGLQAASKQGNASFNAAFARPGTNSNPNSRHGVRPTSTFILG